MHAVPPQKKKNEEILKDLHITQVREFVEKYRRNWKERVGSTSADRFPKSILKYQLKRKRNLGGPFKRWNASAT
jgi:hypothetical protein